MNVLSKQERIEQSICSIFILLKEIQINPEAFSENEAITKALRNQSNLCKLNFSFTSAELKYHISPLSLNTIKQKLHNSDKFENFDQLNRLRLLAIDSLANHGSKQNQVKKRNKSGLEDIIKELKASIESLHAINMVLLQALATNINDLKTIKDTPNTGLRQKRIDDALQRITLILSLNPTPFDDPVLAFSRKHLRLVTNE